MHGVIEVCPPNSPYLFLLSAVYATSSVNNRDILRDDFKTIAQYIALSWISLGDFNEVLNQNKKLGGRRVNQRRCLVCRDNMDVCKMIDLGFSGPRFTWTNNRKRHPIYERLDRGWGNMEWLEKLPKTNVMHLPRISSDYCPIRVRTCLTIPRGGQKPFRFEPMWILHPDFHSMIQSEWVRGEGTFSINSVTFKSPLMCGIKRCLAICIAEKPKPWRG